MTKKFITFEGGEGSGKSTQSKLLQQKLLSFNIASILTREPGGTPQGEEIRNLVLKGSVDKFNAITELLLHMAARSEHIELLIKPYLNQDYFVISDRFLDSTIAYQGIKLGEHLVKQLHQIIFNNFYPELTFILAVDPEIAIERAKVRDNENDHNRYEKMDIQYHYEIFECFKQLAMQNPKKYYLIDGHLSVETIHNKIINIMNDKYNLTL